MNDQLKMTAMQKVQALILARAYGYMELDVPEITADNIDPLWGKAESDDDWEGALSDGKSYARSGEVETGLPCDWSRHYESKSVAAKAPDGTWVGWTYWYGGGKHGEPESIDWIEGAYDIDCAEEEKLVVVRTFTKPE